MSYIYLDRELFAHPLWGDKPYARGQAWVDLIQLAQFRPSYFYVRGIRVDVGRGQLCHSQEKLAERWGWGKRKVANFLSDLIKDLQIEIKAHHRISIITICNYNDYQSKRPTDDTTDCTTNSTTNSTHKKERKEIKEEPPYPQGGMPDAFWELFPRQRRGDKDKAARAWRKAITKATELEIMDGLRAYVKSDEVARGFAKGAAAWLNDSRWSNQYQPAAQTRGSPML